VKDRPRFAVHFFAVLALAALPAAAQQRITTPKEHFGFDIGDDYCLANYKQMTAYWQKLAAESRRMRLVEIGRTAEGRPMQMAILTSPQNHEKLEQYKDTAARLARAEGLAEEQARALARTGKAVVWIDGGLHATEVLGAQQLIEMVYQMASREDTETRRILDDVVLLAAIANPDGMDLVSDWYMRESEPARRSMAGLPRLYQKYIGHDNNRDFYMSTQPETEAINRVFYLEWFPQIIYNHHQTGPAGTVLFAPPFRDPFNYYFDPLVPVGIDLVSAAMHNRFIAEGKAGATMRTGAAYSTWWNGGLRTTAYFHNMIGILTETIGNPTPMEIPLVLQNQLPRGDLPAPIAPQRWHLRQSIEYSVTANRAILDLASRYREHFLFNIYRMGNNSIERGGRDTWTVHPEVIEAARQASGRGRGGEETQAQGGGGRGAQTLPAKQFDLLRDPAKRDPRGFVLTADQPDFLTATKFVNTLIKTGISVLRATAPFEAAGKRYPAGSYVVKCAQAFRPHILDMFEPQDHPNDVPYPGGPPRPPYDSAGYTLAFQMGVRFDRVLDGFEGPFAKIEGLAAPPPGRIGGGERPAGYLLSHRVNDAFVAVNRLLAAGVEVFRLLEPFRSGVGEYPAGTIYIPAAPAVRPILDKLAASHGLNFDGTGARPGGEAHRLRTVRIGLWDRYGGSMTSGWTRWLLERFEFPFEVVYAPALDGGNLAARFDVLIFPDGAIPSAGGMGGRGGGGGFSQAADPARVPQEYRDRLGNFSVGKTVPQLRRFLEEGGTILTIGSSTSLATHLGLPLANHLVERQADGTERPLPRERFYVPGSLLRARIDTASPLAWGMEDPADFFFDSSPVFRLRPDAAQRGVRAVAWYEGRKVLRSGWAMGEGYLDQGVAVAEASVGRGRLFLFGPEIAFRAQPHGTFKLLFNGIYYGKAAAPPR